MLSAEHEVGIMGVQRRLYTSCLLPVPCCRVPRGGALLPLRYLIRQFVSITGLIGEIRGQVFTGHPDTEANALRKVALLKEGFHPFFYVIPKICGHRLIDACITDD